MVSRNRAIISAYKLSLRVPDRIPGFGRSDYPRAADMSSRLVDEQLNRKPPGGNDCLDTDVKGHVMGLNFTAAWVCV